MSEQRLPGRRRAHNPAAELTDEAASFTEMAMMWRSISRAHEVLARHHSQFATTPTDTRLAEQLSIVSMLHEWRPTTATEARELAYLLDLYAEPAGDATSDEAANAANAAIRRMAVRRVKAGPPESWETAS